MFNLSSTHKFQIGLLIIFSIVYLYRSNYEHHSFVDEIPIDVNTCVDEKLAQLLSSPRSDYEVVDLALKGCDNEVRNWLKSYTSMDDDYDMTYSYLREHYISEIKYSRQPEAGG